MTKLSATDAGFIYAETGDCPMSIASLQMLELPPNMGVDEFIESLRHYIFARRHLVPYLTNRIEWTSGLFDHPNWVADPGFDINQHIYPVEVPAPGDRRAMEQTVARLHETPLDRSRPLWDMAVLTGLEHGRIAYYNRVHHACLDGMAAQASTHLLMDAAGQTLRNKLPLPGAGGRSRNWLHHGISLWQDLASQTVDNIANAPRRAVGFGQLWQTLASPEAGLAHAHGLSPHTPLNRRIDSRRVYATTELPIPALKQISRQLKCTVNDVFLAICGGALRSYLERHNALPEDTLHAGCPVSLRNPRDQTANNQVGMMRVALGSDIADPVARLLTIKAATARAKALTAAGAACLPANLTLPGMGIFLRGAQMMTGLTRMADRAPPPFNVLISNVPGPREPLTSNGARLLTHYPMSIPTHGLGVNITVQSYVDTLYVGITAAARVMPDADLLRDDIQAAYDALNNALSADVVEFASSPAIQNMDTNQEVKEIPPTIEPRVA